MAKHNIDVLLDTDGDDLVRAGDFAIGDCIADDCLIIFKLNTGALKSDPLLAPNLIKLINDNSGSSSIQKALRINLQRDNKIFKRLNVNNGIIDFKL